VEDIPRSLFLLLLLLRSSDDFLEGGGTTGTTGTTGTGTTGTETTGNTSGGGGGKRAAPGGRGGGEELILIRQTTLLGQLKKKIGEESNEWLAVWLHGVWFTIQLGGLRGARLPPTVASAAIITSDCVGVGVRNWYISPFKG
jgi:hypothetical protein